jgi:hypothetical protein
VVTFQGKKERREGQNEGKRNNSCAEGEKRKQHSLRLSSFHEQLRAGQFVYLYETVAFIKK